MVADAAPAAPAYRCRTGDRIARFVFERLSNLFRNRIGYRLGGCRAYSRRACALWSRCHDRSDRLALFYWHATA